MKHLSLKILLVSAFVCYQVTHAQINLVHTFDEQVMFTTGFVDGVANWLSDTELYPANCYYYTSVNQDNSYSVKIYNPDYSVYLDKTYVFTAPTGYKLSLVTMAKKLFNSDDKYEFIVSYKKEDVKVYDNAYSWVQLCDENGNVLKDFGIAGSVTVYPILQVVNDECRLLVWKYNYDEDHNLKLKTEVYAFANPGATSAEETIIKSKLAFPNPTNAMIHLPYSLKKGVNGIMNIINTQGQLITRKQITSDFNEILLDVSTYVAGVYYYEVNGVTNKFIVE